MEIIKRALGKIPYEIKLIFIVFFITRSILTFVGVYSRNHANESLRKWYVWSYTDKVWLDIWSVWDSGWYLDIAQNGYSTTLQSDLPKRTCCGQNNFGFFPLYPLTIRFFGNIIGNYHTAAILLSNVFLLFSSLILYKLVARIYNKNIATLSVTILYTFPTSVILSGIFSESLFLLLLLLSFYFATQDKWLACGISGYLLALTRPTGFLVYIPLLYEYFRRKKTDYRDALFLLMIPLGILTFMMFTYFKTGDFLYYFHLKTLSWGYRLTYPFEPIFTMFSSGGVLNIIGLFTLFNIFFIFAGFSIKELSFFVLSSILVLSAFANGSEVAIGIPRMSSVIFPVFINIAKIISNKNLYLKIFSITVLFALEIVSIICLSNGMLIL